MGYTTDFEGTFNLTTPLTEAQAAYLHAFSGTRRMKRNVEEALKLEDPTRKAVDLPLGQEAGYFVGNQDDFGQGRDASIVDYNKPPTGQPGLWCQWVPTEDNEGIAWDGGEKFYSYIPWLKYLIENFLKPWGHVLNGTVEWEGEESDDRGKIEVVDNKITIYRGETTYTKCSE